MDDMNNLLDPFIQKWVEEIGAHDPWLAAEARDRIARDGSLSCLVMAGLLTRLWLPPSGEVSEILRMYREGEYDSRLARARVWVTSLSMAQREVLEGLAVTAADTLLKNLRELQSSMQIFETSWQKRFDQLLCDRDDLEGTLLLLECRELQYLLALMDVECMPMIQSLNSMFLGPSNKEQLRRAFAVSPTAWWATSPQWEPKEGE